MMELISQKDQVKTASPKKQMNNENNETQNPKINADKEDDNIMDGFDLSGCSSDDEFEEDSDNDYKYKYDKNTNHMRENALDINKSQLSVNLKDKRNTDPGYLLQRQNDKEITNANSLSQNNLVSINDEDEQEMRRNIINSVPLAIPIITSQYSLKPDMMFGWKPQINITGAPIPLYFDYEWFDIPINPVTNEEYDVAYYGHRFKDSLEMHKAFANRTHDSYKFKFPPNMNVLEAMAAGQKRKREDQPREFIGMNPILVNQQGIINPSVFKQPSLIFDSRYECGNLDMAIQIRDNEYDLYMRVDSNTRGHHQWFNFTVHNNSVKGKVKFNIVNFTKNASLYHQGMKINILSQREQEISKTFNNQQQNEGWIKGGENISYKLSKLSQVLSRQRRYFQLSFEYEFQHQNDKVQFSYSVPYTFSRLYNLVKSVMKEHQQLLPDIQSHFIKEQQLCKSISGLEVPMLTITSRVNKQNFEEIDPQEFITSEVEIESSPPLNKYKKYIIVCSRVHPGETNASFIMEGFLKFITSTSPEAIELRKRVIFKVIPMTNPDGVIVGNYRTGLCGNDLNRQFITPNTKLHPTVCSIKSLVSGIIQNAKEPEPIASFIDIHGHSRKKSIFIYGPYFPLHNERYLKMRVLPKLLSERTEMFRFFSCKFRIQKSKLKAARVVLWKEFGIMNCFTLEASFHGFINRDRQTIPLTTESLMKMGEILGSGFYEYQTLIEEDDKQKLLIKQQIKNKKKRMKAKDIVKAYTKQQEQQIQGQGKTTALNNDQFLSSDQDEKKINANDRSQSQTIQKGAIKESQLSKASSNLNQIQKRTQSLGLKDQNNNASQNRRLESSQPSFISTDLMNMGAVETVQEAKRSSAENSSKNNNSFRDPFEDIDQLKRKPFRIKKQKLPLPGLPKSDNANEKRTLKSIYKLLKRDMKTMTIPTHGQPQNDQIKAVNKQGGGGISSDSDDSDDDALDCCENDDSDGNDDLTPSELEELQNNIIEAIENFDKIYNKSTLKSKKGKKKSTNKGQNNLQELQQNLKSLQLDQNNVEDIQKLVTLQNQKEPNTSKSKQKQMQSTTSNYYQQTPLQQQQIQVISKQHIKKIQNPLQVNQLNSNRLKDQQQSQSSQYQKYIMQQNNHTNNNQSVFKQGNSLLLNDRSTMPLQVSGMIVRSSQQQQYNQYPQMNLKNQQLKDLNKSNPSQNEIIYQGVSQNVRNLIKFVNPHITNINQRNQMLQGSQQLLIQSKSQDKYRQGDHTSSTNNEEGIMKSFENFSQKLQSKSSNNRPNIYQNRSQIHDSLQKSQIIENNQKVMGIVSVNSLQQNSSLQNSRIGQSTQSRSSRVIFGDQDKSGRGSIQPISSQQDNKLLKNSQFSNIRTPTSAFLQNQGALILGTPKKDQDLDQDDSNKSKSLRAYSFSSHLNEAVQSSQNIFLDNKHQQQQQQQQHQYVDNTRGFNKQNMNYNAFSQNNQSQPLNFNYKSDNEGLHNNPNIIQQNVFRQNIFKDQPLTSLNQIPLPSLPNQNQNLIIQNIIIGNFHNDQRIQINSPNSPGNNKNQNNQQTTQEQQQQQDSFREQIIQKHKKKRRKSKRKSKDLKGNNFPTQFIDTKSNNYSNQNNIKSQKYQQISGNQTMYPSSDTHKNSFISNGLVDQQKVGRIQGLKYIGLQNQESVNSNSMINPYSESQNFDKRRKNIQQYSAAPNTQNQSNVFMSDGEIEDNHKHFNQKRPSEKSQQPSHQKKLSIEYDQIIKNQEKDNSVLGLSSIYNLKPLKDMIQSNLNQVKYMKNQLPTTSIDQHQTNIIKKPSQLQQQQQQQQQVQQSNIKNQTFYQKSNGDQFYQPPMSGILIGNVTESGRQSKQPPFKGRQIVQQTRQQY